MNLSGSGQRQIAILWSRIVASALRHLLRLLAETQAAPSSQKNRSWSLRTAVIVLPMRIAWSTGTYSAPILKMFHATSRSFPIAVRIRISTAK